MKHYVYVRTDGFVAASVSTPSAPATIRGTTILEVPQQVRCIPPQPGWQLRASDLQWIDARGKSQKDADQWAVVREKRDALLAESDRLSGFYRLADRGQPITPEWQTYRDALRDITLQADPFNIVWPVFQPTPPITGRSGQR